VKGLQRFSFSSLPNLSSFIHRSRSMGRSQLISGPNSFL
jgi:hypothetical protein